MRAIVQEETGTADVLTLQEIPEPEVRPTDVLIRVAACGVCYHDVVVRNGVFRRKVHLPLVPGHEVAGIVEKVGTATHLFRVGDRVCTAQRRSVCGYCRECRSGFEVNCASKEFMGDAHLNGGYAELVAVSEDCVAAVPATIPLDQASIVACAIGTALNAIRDVGKVRLGESVLITGASGGQGAHGVQLARASGAHVVAVVSTEAKAEAVRDLGAHDVIVTSRGADFSNDVRAVTSGRGVDVVIDNVGARIYEPVRRSLAKHGRWVLVGALGGETAPFNSAQLFLHDISMLSAVSCSRRQLEDALTLVERGLVRPLVSRVLPLALAASAHADLERSGVMGRIILKPDPEKAL
ncbi:quinone oxidoreductase family protein [Paraburkholderia sp.]|uniref:quinone oxidoreductase family protein n=1 Tax=Paraburkholderia sp. TaxID=1926495 RepID=UPI002D5206FA|nr:zinc-binding dehydrogenase [Paraburkholderia sp.]HZZ01739.1 zinc-binding dehydrogenase [Paraburkholderia sp.]